MSHYFQDDPRLVSNIKEISFEINGLKCSYLPTMVYFQNTVMRVALFS